MNPKLNNSVARCILRYCIERHFMSQNCSLDQQAIKKALESAILFVFSLDLDLTAELHHTVGWNLIEITHRAGIALH